MDFKVIRDMMDKFDLKDRDMAVLLGINYGNISIWRTGKKKIPQKHHARIIELSKIGMLEKTLSAKKIMKYKILKERVFNDVERYAINNTYRLIRAINEKFSCRDGKKLVQMALSPLGKAYMNTPLGENKIMI